MKKYNLAKILGLTFLIGVILTWIIPTGYFSNGEFYSTGTNPAGLLTLFRMPLNTLANFVHYGIVFLTIGGLYRVLNKTGAYTQIVDKVVSKYEAKKEKFLIISLVIFILLSSLIGMHFLLFVLVPFFTTVLLLLGYSKITALVTTVGSILVGGLGATYSNYINTTLKYFFGISTHNEILTRIIFLIIIAVLFVLFVTKRANEEITKEEKKINPNKIPLYNKNASSERSCLPLIIIAIVTFVFLMVAMFDWQNAFGISFFNDLHTSIIELNINGYPIVSNIIGAVNAIGNWTMYYDLPVTLTIVTVVIAWVYSLSFKDTIDAYVSGVKEMLPVAFYAVMANIVFALIYFSQSGTDIVNAVANFLLNLGDKVQLISMMLTSIFTSAIYNDFIQTANVLSGVASNTFNNSVLYPQFALVIQFMYGLTMFVVPTSVLLIAGLSYFEISYKEWLSYIWKYVLYIFGVVLVVLAIVTLFV